MPFHHSDNPGRTSFGKDLQEDNEFTSADRREVQPQSHIV